MSLDNILKAISSVKLTHFVFLLSCLVVFLFFNENNRLKVEYLSDLYYIQEDFAKNSYEETLLGNSFHQGLFELINKENRRSNSTAINIYTGVCLCKIGYYVEAISYLEKVNVSDTFLLGKVRMLIGDCYVNLSEYDKALDSFLKATKLLGESKDMMVGLIYKIVLIYEEKKMYKEALDLLKNTLQKFKNDGDLSLLKDEREKIKLLLRKMNIS